MALGPVTVVPGPLLMDFVDERAACSLRLVSTIVPFPLNARHDLVLRIRDITHIPVPACSAVFAAVALIQGRAGLRL